MSKTLSETIVSSDKITILNIDFQCMIMTKNGRQKEEGWGGRKGKRLKK
jgi:hypothetical protein